MGACGSSSGAVANEQQVSIQLLLLGSANVGKSTIFKQMRLLYANGFDDKLRVWAKGCIIENVLQTLSDLDQLSEELGIDLVEENEDLVDEIKPVLLNYRGRDPDEPPPEILIWYAALSTRAPLAEAEWRAGFQEQQRMGVCRTI